LIDRANRGALANALDISERTLSNWLTRPEDHPIPLTSFLALCKHLGVVPARVLGGANCEVLERTADPVTAEQRLFAREKAIPVGGVKRVVYPLFSPPLMCDALLGLYAWKGTYKRFFPPLEPHEHGDGVNRIVQDSRTVGGRRLEDFFRIRQQRRQYFEDANYIIRLLFMRNEFEAWLNGERLFKRLSAKDKVEQLDYLLRILTTLTWHNQPRLLLRMTTSVLRMQYSLFPEPPILLSANTGLIFTDEQSIVSFLELEFSAMWEENTLKQLRSTDEWVTLLSAARDYLCSGMTEKPFKVEEFLPAL
jgi:hypothetical protein